MTRAEAGRLGGLKGGRKGGKNRWKGVSDGDRSDHGSMMAEARWEPHRQARALEAALLNSIVSEPDQHTWKKYVFPVVVEPEDRSWTLNRPSEAV